MKKDNNNIEADLQFAKIELLQSNIFNTNLTITNNSFAFEILTETQLNEETKSCFVIVTAKVYDLDKSELLGDISTNSIFYIDNFTEIITSNEACIKSVPNNLNTVLNAIALSTTRGIMWSTFKGTILHNAILPIVDAKQFTNLEHE